MSTQTKYEQDIIRLNDRKDYPLWCIQVRNELRTKRCEAAIEDDFEMPLRQTAVETLLDEGWRPEDCNDMRLVSDKLKSLLDTYDKAKGDSVGVIQGRVHRSKLCLLEGKITAREMWLTLQKEFDISRASEIGAITNAILRKSFDEFETVSDYCQAFQEAYNEMASRLVNNNGGHNQNKHYEILLQGAMLDKLPAAYASLVATMDDEWTNYTSADLPGTIHKIKRYLKTDPLKILHATSIPSSSNSNKRPRQTPESSVCSHPICFSKNYHHPIDKCWELHPELRPAPRRTRAKPANIKIKSNTTSENVKNEAPTFNLS